MLTCYGDLSRNRSVGIRLGRGEKLADIVASSSQVRTATCTQHSRACLASCQGWSRPAAVHAGAHPARIENHSNAFYQFNLFRLCRDQVWTDYYLLIRAAVLTSSVCVCAQVAEGVATAGVVVGLARKYRVQLPVLTAVAQVRPGSLRLPAPKQRIFNTSDDVLSSWK